MRTITVPFTEKGWIGLPDEWLGKHAARRDEAVKAATEKKLPTLYLNFAVAMSLLEDWGDIPGLDGNPEKWDFDELLWNVMAFITGFVFGDVDRAMEVPKNSSEPLPTG